MKMFRPFFVFALAFYLSSFAISQKKSPNEVNFNDDLPLGFFIFISYDKLNASVLNLILCDLSLFSVWRIKMCRRFEIFVSQGA